LLDLQGRVIGVNSQIISPSQASAGIGFAVSANTVQRVVPQLISQGRYPHPWLGVNLLDLNSDLVEVLRQAGADITRDTGLLVIEAVAGGPAATAGIRGAQSSVVVGSYRIPVGGDIIVALAGKPILNQSDLAVYLDTQTRVGDRLDVTVVRDGQERTFTVTLQERPSTS
jgi:S1-C subfamily serine protease